MGLKNVARNIVKFLRTSKKIAVPQITSFSELLVGKTAIITGGSSGIGFAIAEKFEAAGAKVIIVGTKEDKIKKCCEHFESGRVKGIVINLNNVSEIPGKLEEAIGLFPGSCIDILVNCAGYHPMKSFLATTEEDFDRTIDTNVKGTFFMSQAVAKHMLENKIKGHILNISSSSALRPAWSPYEVSKWAIRGFTLGLADMLIKQGIVVNAVAPGPTATPMLGVDEKGDLDMPNNPSGRFATPAEIANFALILASDMGNLVVGDTVYATGGSGVVSLHR
ncbi:MAG: SDR family oxidoreductase [Butyrivibrio sp.]|nr:SDR family oxidoreductase [Butyrivibrio sp.]